MSDPREALARALENAEHAGRDRHDLAGAYNILSEAVEHAIVTLAARQDEPPAPEAQASPALRDLLTNEAMGEIAGAMPWYDESEPDYSEAREAILRALAVRQDEPSPALRLTAIREVVERLKDKATHPGSGVSLDFVWVAPFLAEIDRLAANPPQTREAEVLVEDGRVVGAAAYSLEDAARLIAPRTREAEGAVEPRYCETHGAHYDAECPACWIVRADIEADPYGGKNFDGREFPTNWPVDHEEGE